MTVALFYLMQSLIASGEGRAEEAIQGITIDFVRLKRESEFDTKERRLPRKTEYPEEPPPPPVQRPASRPLHPPLYPMRASTRGIEGWVVVEFTITETGSVEDAHVVQADPPRVFDSAAVKAIRRWKYKPKVTGGKPVAQVGVRTLISFELEE